MTSCSTADAVTGGVHFFPDDPPDAIARKALRVNLSDLAAKGAKPIGFLMTLALPAGIDDAWLEKFSTGLGADAEGVRLSAIRRRYHSHPGAGHSFDLRFRQRSARQDGQAQRRQSRATGFIVTGTIGDAALGLRLRKEPMRRKNWKLDTAMRDHLLGRYLMPQPRLGLADALQAHASAAMDVSDGLVGDLTKLCGVSGVSADIDVVVRPAIGSGAQRALASDTRLMETILTGGDDYEIVCAMKPDEVPTFRARAAMADIAVTDIGVVVDGTHEPRFIGADGPLSFARKSFSHF